MKTILFVSLVALSFNCAASLEDQLRSIQAEEVQEAQKVESAEQKRQESKKVAAQQKADEAARKAASLQAERARMIVVKKAEALVVAKARQEKEEAKTNERLADKYREQAYEDEIRELEMMERRAMAKARAKNAERMVNTQVDSATADVEMKRSATDLIQSKADTNRIEAKGNKALKEKLGDAVINTSEAEVNKSKSWLN